MIFLRHQCICYYHYLQHRFVSSTTRIITNNNLPAIAYRPENVEKNKFLKWEREGWFKAENPSNRPTFCMVLPPPNVTGRLHLGHALACTVQDVVVRRKRSLGYNVLWLPGTDHAGIATQGVVEKYLKSKHNINRQDLSKQDFVNEVWRWKELYGGTICQQLRIMGNSLDWSREVFTMDEAHTKAVNTAFIRLFQKGLIYRKKALVNWCTELKSTVSDIEVDNIEISSPIEMKLHGYEVPVKFGLMYNFAYKIFDSDEEVVVSTTMPETMLGDTAIAVHPDDNRYSHLRGKIAVHPFTNKTIPIIFDDFVDMGLGTGAVKITPAHSKVDYEIGKHHKLGLVQVIAETGTMVNAGKFTNMKRYECRQKLVERLNNMGLLRDIVPHKMNLPICSRTGGVIDHLPKEQWFLYCHKMNETAAELVRSGQLKIEPEKFVKNWLDWTGDDRDWCISRQLWWGHQIPAYKCTSHRDLIWVAAEDEALARDEASKYLRTLPEEIIVERDTDVLDTWFSSGIYPFAALGWPDNSLDFKKFYPLSLMATGHDILGFWVHRMVILGLELTGRLPFDKILLHGIICDKKGAKMSKSKGNVIDPLDVIYGISMDELRRKTLEMHCNGVLSQDELEKAMEFHKSNLSHLNGIPECGVDALRFTLLTRDIKSHYVHFDLDLCHTNKLFGNKIWQSIKYTQLSYAKLKPLDTVLTRDDLSYFDRWILSRLAGTVQKVNDGIEDYNFHIATKALKSLLYQDFCDLYIEATKSGFDEDVKLGFVHAHTLSALLNTSLRCLSPFMVHLTEELIPTIPDFETNIICNYTDANKNLTFPQYEDFQSLHDQNFERKVNKLINTVLLVRQLKGFYGISNKLRPAICISSKDNDLASDIINNRKVFLNLTRCKSVEFDSKFDDRKFVSGVLDDKTTVSVELIADDIEKVIDSTRGRLEKKIRKIEESLCKLEAKFSSDKYLLTAPEWTQLLDKESLTTKKEQLKLLQRLKNV